MQAIEWGVFTQFGIAGLILGVFFIILLTVLRQNSSMVRGIVNRMSTDHKESNDAWRNTFEVHSNRADVRQGETNAVLRDLAVVMTENNVCISHLKRDRNNGHNETQRTTD